MVNYSHRSKSDLKKLYIEKDLTQKEVGERCNVSTGTISKWLNKFEIDTGYNKHTDQPTKLIEENYNNNKTFQEMAEGTKLGPSKFRHMATSIGVHKPEKHAYTDEELVELIQKEYNETPSKKDIQKNNKLPSESTFRSHFRTWNNAVKSAGFEPNKDKDSAKWTKKEISDAIEDFASGNNTILAAEFYESEFGPNSPHPVYNTFGSFEKLLQESSVEEKKYPAQYKSNKYICDKIRKIGDVVSRSDIEQSNKLPSINAIRNRFNSIQNACDEANVEYRGRQKYTKDEIRQKIQRLSQSEPYRWSDIKKISVSPNTIVSKTNKDTIAGAMEELGFEYKTQKFTDEELIAKMNECNERYEEVKVGLFKQDEKLPSWLTYVNRFGSWSQAKERAGITPETNGRPIEYESGYDTYLYGTTFLEKRELVRERANRTCQSCGIVEPELERKLDVHHIKPVRSFKNAEDAHTFDNLVALCHDCHMSIEANNLECPDPPQSK